MNISLTTSARNVAIVAALLGNSMITPALAVVLPTDGDLTLDVTVVLEENRIVEIYRLLSRQPEGIAAALNKELEQLLLAKITEDPEGFQELSAKLEQVNNERMAEINRVAAAGAEICRQYASLIIPNLNK